MYNALALITQHRVTQPTRDRGGVLATRGLECEDGPSDGKGSLNIDRTEFDKERLGERRPSSSAPLATVEPVTVGATCSNQSNRNRRRERLICTSRSVCSTLTLKFGERKGQNTSAREKTQDMHQKKPPHAASPAVEYIDRLVGHTRPRNATMSQSIGINSPVNNPISHRCGSSMSAAIRWKPQLSGGRFAGNRCNCKTPLCQFGAP